MNDETLAAPRARLRMPPLWLQTALALLLGVALGAFTGRQPIVGSLGTEQLAQLGMLVIQALKVLAVPLVAFVVLDSLLRFEVPARQGLRLVRFCLVNVSVAMVVGLVLTNWLKPGTYLRALFEPLLHRASGSTSEVTRPAVVHALDPLAGLASLIPSSIAAPFVENAVVPAALLALLFGVALRRANDAPGIADRASSFATLRGVVHMLAEALQRSLSWVVKLAPIAAFTLVAHAVGSAGLRALSGLWMFLAVVSLGFVIHGLLYYPLMAWLLGKRSPRVFLGGARDALITGIATNSSLATVPVTLRCIVERLGVSPTSARISTCLGANLNHDGIALYEAMAALAIAQAVGLELGFAQQLGVVAASVMAGMGIAGIPEAGIVLLPTVLSAAGLPIEIAMAAVPLVMPVDWILARARTAMNVLSDILVAILLDRESPVAAPASETDCHTPASHRPTAELRGLDVV